MKAHNLTNKRSGKLIAIKYLYTNKRYNRVWECKCDCGNKTEVTATHFVRNLIQSCGCLAKLPKTEASFNDLYSRYKYRAEKVLNIEFQLSKSFFKQITQQNCYYCGIEPHKKFIKHGKQYHGSYIYNGVDRIDNRQGYLESNVVPCCKICNKAKLDLSLNDFLNWIERLKTYER